jgi:REP element-mobilizing transposase RayT
MFIKSCLLPPLYLTLCLVARTLRIELPGAVYHVTSRGDRREPIFIDDADRHALLAVVGHGTERFDAEVPAYCLMGNHYHFVVYNTHQANLSLLMRHINGVYTQAFNRRQHKVGHLRLSIGSALTAADPHPNPLPEGKGRTDW